MMTQQLRICFVAFYCFVAGCGQSVGMSADAGPEEPADGGTVPLSAFRLSSTTLKAEFAPEQFFNTFGCTGSNTSPDLKWVGAPEGTKSFAVTLFDKDAPTGSGFWHWVAYNIPASTTSFAMGDISSKRFPAGLVEGNTDLAMPGYFGPCPPMGRKHRYEFTVHALKVEKLEVPGGAAATAASVNFHLWLERLGQVTLSATAGPR
jgi:Raf kinase inhibitor-like YbhB/YbcL family protein